MIIGLYPSEDGDSYFTETKTDLCLLQADYDTIALRNSSQMHRGLQHVLLPPAINPIILQAVLVLLSS